MEEAHWPNRQVCQNPLPEKSLDGMSKLDEQTRPVKSSPRHDTDFAESGGTTEAFMANAVAIMRSCIRDFCDGRRLVQAQVMDELANRVEMVPRVDGGEVASIVVWSAIAILRQNWTL